MHREKHTATNRPRAAGGWIDETSHLYGFISFTFYTELPAFRWPKRGTKKTLDSLDGQGRRIPDKRALRARHGH
jgi:hypothetical protein